jgi:hypothetical protein
MKYQVIASLYFKVFKEFVNKKLKEGWWVCLFEVKIVRFAGFR